MKLSLNICPLECCPTNPNITKYIENPKSLCDHLDDLVVLKQLFPNTPMTMPVLDNITVDDIRVKFITQVCMREYRIKQTTVTRDWIPTLVGTGDGGWLLFFEDEELLNSTEYLFGITRIDEKQLKR